VKPLTWVRQHRAVAVLAASAAGSLLTWSLAAPAGAAAPQSHPRPSKIAVPQGISAAALQNAGVFTPGSTPETVSFILKARNQNELESRVEAGMRGGYLSVAGFASQYGQPHSNIAALEKYLAGFGITTSSAADGLDVTAQGTADQFNSALSVKQHQFSIPAVKAKDGHPGHPRMTVHGTKDTPLLPRALGQFVLSILGLSNYPSFSTDLVHTPKLAKGVKPAVEQDGALTPADFAQQYNLNPLYAKGATGAGRTVGIVTLASLDPATAEFFWNNILNIPVKANRITLDNIDGGSGPVSDASGSGETTLDVEQSGALSPQSNIVVYQAPNTDPGFLDAFYTAASQNVADSVSTSWGEAETVINAGVASGTETAAYALSFDDAFLEMAAQGQSMFDTAGDSGAFDDSAELGTTNLDVDSPGDSPWATASGGTTLPGTIPLTSTDSATVASQRAWGWDWLWPHFADFGAPSEADFAFAEALGGGGGFSAIEAAPPYQRGINSTRNFSATEYLTPTDPQQIAPGITLPTQWLLNANPSVITGHGSGRVLPDLSTNADPFTGYELYFTFGDKAATVEDGWGGTSFVAPQLNGATALMDSLVGHRIGFWNPMIYRFATQHNSPFSPLDSASNTNTNLFYTGTPGHIFNVGTGLGTPDLAKLFTDFGQTEGFSHHHHR
jgi:subtilase family serine protease